MQWIENFQLFLFDFDGLLVNTEHIHYQAYVYMLMKRGFTLDWSFPKYCEMAHASSEGLKLAVYAKFPQLLEMQPNWEILRKEKKNIYFELIKSAKVEMMPGAEQLLLALERLNKKRCVVTHSLKEETDLIRSKVDVLKSLPHWVTREDYIRPKPDPEGYLRAIQLFGEKGDKIIGFEDSIRGIKALMKTPAKGVLICHAHHPQLDVVLKSEISHFESLEEISEASL